MSDTRVPTKISLYDLYVILTNSHLLAEIDLVPNWTRLGLSQADMTKWTKFKTDWVALYATYTNPETSTSIVKKKLNLLKMQSTRSMEPILDIISVSPNITVEDRTIFRIKKRSKNYNKRGKIPGFPFGLVTPTINGGMKTRVRTTSDASRASINPLSDGYIIIYTFADQMPRSITELKFSKTLSSALDFFEVGSENAGLGMFYAIAWVNKTNHLFNSDFGPIQKTIVL